MDISASMVKKVTIIFYSLMVSLRFFSFLSWTQICQKWFRSWAQFCEAFRKRYALETEKGEFQLILLPSVIQYHRKKLEK